MPGSTARLEAVLTDSGVPLSRSASVRARITGPDGTLSSRTLVEGDPGVHAGSIPTTISGVYRVLVDAGGTDLRGSRFSREELRTVAVWARGDDQPPLVIDPGSATGGGLDACQLLACVLRDEGVRTYSSATR